MFNKKEGQKTELSTVRIRNRLSNLRRMLEDEVLISSITRRELTDSTALQRLTERLVMVKILPLMEVEFKRIINETYPDGLVRQVNTSMGRDINLNRGDGRACCWTTWLCDASRPREIGGVTINIAHKSMQELAFNENNFASRHHINCDEADIFRIKAMTGTPVADKTKERIIIVPEMIIIAPKNSNLFIGVDDFAKRFIEEISTGLR